MIAVVSRHGDPGLFWTMVALGLALLALSAVAIWCSEPAEARRTRRNDLRTWCQSIAAHQARTETLRGHR